MLDVPSITFLANYLQSYPSTVLVVSHDRAFLNEVATDIIHQHSERLDYYKGANFGIITLTKTLLNVSLLNIVLCQIRSMQPRKNAERTPNENMRTRWHSEHICKVRYCPQHSA
jgi:ATPase subunit of ABC transporter with duplicated ATPase domains